MILLQTDARKGEHRHEIAYEQSASQRAVCLTAIVLLLIALAKHAAAEPATYRLEVNNTWSEQTHPGNFPDKAHFSWFAGATHNDQVMFWDVGQLASPGIKRMAEDGTTFILESEVEAAVTAGLADSSLSYHHWFCPSGTTDTRCGTLTVEFEVREDSPLITLVSMLGPSPDWFVGVSDLSLRQNGKWRPQIKIDLLPFDAGTRSANQLELFGPLNNPPEAITQITAASGQLIGPGSLGTMTFTLVPEPSAVALLMGGFLVLAGPRWRLH